MKKEQFFSRAQLRELRAQFATIKTVNPESPVLDALRAFVQRLPEPQRAQLAANEIPWVSLFARQA